MKSVLFVCWHFYPSAEVAAKRVAKFCKYLPRFDCKPIVLTVKEPYFDSVDPGLKHDTAAVYRTNFLTVSPSQNRFGRLRHYAFKVFEKFCFPDRYITWLPFALWKARRILRENRVDVIYASGPWFSSFLIGYVLNAIYKIPLIIEYRDQWSLNVVYKSKKTASWHRYLDKRIMQRTDKIVFSSGRMLEEYRTHFPEVNFCKAVVIPNSFDPDDFKQTKPLKHDEFVITHTGHFYWPRSPETFLQALYELVEEAKLRKGEFKFVNIGNLDRSRYDSNGFVDMKGVLPHHEVITHLASSDGLLLIVAHGHESNIPAKLYEYLAVCKPVLAICPKGASVRDIIAETNSGVCANIDDVAEIKRKLLQMVASREDGFSPLDERIEPYRAVNTTRQLARLIASLN